MNDDLLALVKLRLEEILTFYGVNTSVKATFTDQTIDLKVDSDLGGRLIGRHGETLQALQQIMIAIVKQHTDEHVYVHLDIADYKQGRDDRLSEQVRAEAAQVAASGEPHTLKPMNAAERRVVHMALADMPEVMTESEGEGLDRRVVIKKAE
jgi:spoIIIJ-associated protein